jgi:hypothetical protein
MATSTGWLAWSMVCALRYDNEAGKGDHKHLGAAQVPYAFTTFDRLLNDFRADIARLGGLR